MAWKIRTYKLTQEMLEKRDSCDACEKTPARYAMLGESTPYDGSQFYALCCAECVKEEEEYYREINERAAITQP